MILPLNDYVTKRLEQAKKELKGAIDEGLAYVALTLL